MIKLLLLASTGYLGYKYLVLLKENEELKARIESAGIVLEEGQVALTESESKWELSE